jgi:D-beta-D-heptose 7-phosphate kinase / D-beta-D-heptose 1-phosphate adenosyltransferase
MTGRAPAQLTPDVVLRLADTRAFVVGDLMVDHYVSGTVDRISPEAPVPVLRAGEEATVLGGAANVAANICGLGGQATLVGLLGKDEAGEQIVSMCADAGVQLDGVLRRPNQLTTVKKRIVAAGQQLIRIDSEERSAATAGDVEAVVGRLRELGASGQANVVVLSDYAKGTVTDAMAREVIDTARSLGLPVVVDPKGTDPSRYAGCTVLKPNIHEARAMAARVLTDASAAGVQDVCQALLDSVDTPHIVVSLAADGVVLATRDEPLRRFRSTALEVADVSGAGDTLVATIAAALGCGLSVAEAVELGNLSAGVSCAHFGTAVVTADQVATAVAAQDDPAESPHIVLDWRRLRSLVDLKRRHGGSLVFANGCFDLLHGGHVSLLEQARRQGDVLVVGLNSDASTRRLKGDGRPLQGVADRLRVMAAVRFVDYVTVFEEDTPLELILALQPDVIVKGADYSAEAVVGAREAEAWNGRVHIVDLTSGLSTTKLSGRGARVPS